MSQLRAPAARPERREGGRHGRPGARSHSAAARPRAAQPSPETRIRPQLLRTAVLPTVAAALSGAAAVIFTVRSTGAGPSTALWIALGAAGTLAIAAVLAAFLAANRVATTVFGRCLALRRASVQGQAELQRVVEQLRNGEQVPVRKPAPPVAPGGDAFELLAQEMGRQQEAAMASVVEASRLADRSGEDQKVEVFVNLARRLQSLVHREIQLLDELEHEVEDPDLLKGLFHVDHLATRIRRHAENLAVLGGAVSRRQWSNPVSMTEVLRSAIAEVEQYPRVKLVPPIAGTLRGHAVADVIHLLAELVENATVFSAPQTQVLLRAQQVTAGLALEVEDRGLGLPGNEQRRMNALLADPDQVNVARLLQDGRIGLFVVASLARRHGIAVRLQSNIYGGTQAVLVLPQTLLGGDGDTAEGNEAAPAPQPEAAHHPSAEPGGHHRPDQGPGPSPDPVPGPQADTARQPYVPGQPLRLHQTPEQAPDRGEAPPLPLRADRPAPDPRGRRPRSPPARTRSGARHHEPPPTAQARQPGASGPAAQGSTRTAHRGRTGPARPGTHGGLPPGHRTRRGPHRIRVRGGHRPGTGPGPRGTDGPADVAEPGPARTAAGTRTDHDRHPVPGPRHDPGPRHGHGPGRRSPRNEHLQGVDAPWRPICRPVRSRTSTGC
ncbi:ATP-binding protein [Streptomyces sp. sk2.1]|uniref:sensor histidine kinase n=1 Tax=Streptomyces sp. sk2.1 TaxID=2478959 RepID=UPI0037DC12F5